MSVVASVMLCVVWAWLQNLERIELLSGAQNPQSSSSVQRLIQYEASAVKHLIKLQSL